MNTTRTEKRVLRAIHNGTKFDLALCWVEIMSLHAKGLIVISRADNGQAKIDGVTDAGALAANA